MRLPFNSIRWRLQAWHGLILLLVMLGFCIPAYRLAVDNQLQQIDKDLMMRERTLVRTLFDMMPPPAASGSDTERNRMPFHEAFEMLRSKPITLPPNVEMLFHGSEPGYAYFGIRDHEGNALLQSENIPPDIIFPEVTQEEMSESSVTINQRRELHRSSSHGFRIVVGRDITPDNEEIRRLAISVLAAGGGVSLLAFVGGWWLVGRAIHPIKDISHTATRIAAGDLAERINIADTASELGKLSQVLNETFERLHEAFERQKQFTADASHELRTPLAIIISETQRILKRERTSEEYKEVIQTCLETSQGMSELVNDLLLLARQDVRETKALREACDLSVIASEVVQRLAPFAMNRGIHIDCALEPAPCEGILLEFAILTTNLVENAIHHHHRSKGHIWIATGKREGRAFLAVRDDGPGIPSDALPHLFERFYRVDAARTGESGHSGLGLSIARAIADSHQAELIVSSEMGRGSMFTLEVNTGNKSPDQRSNPPAPM